MSQVVVGIPARLASTRFPRKLLAPLAGKPVLAHTIARAQEAGLGEVFVATADDEIALLAAQCGVRVIRTKREHPNGTSRLAEAIEAMDCEIVVNLQGDEPLIEPDALRAVVAALQRDPEAVMATIATPIRNKERFEDPHTVKVVCDCRNRALYFTRSPIPHAAPAKALAHIGLYAYRRAFLLRYPALAPTPLEQAERLEQLRALEHGFAIAVAVGDYEALGIDTPEDLARAQARLCKRTTLQEKD